ncbi:hypothetical protein CTR2_R32210 [Comamonas thiooxydans]|uniref:hypothetical protein n=1 Tax=Comamonas thiooxydans TaxID=363952 RepID=UPI0011221267|nr:hypothetical protein [Comamonas thiooxydans]BDR09883.1 hypothetical protein CTR2_R32210 [Comamonas thiooxydans]
MKSQGRGIHRQHRAWVMDSMIGEKTTIFEPERLPICQPWCQSLCYFVPKSAQICAKGRATQLLNATQTQLAWLWWSLNECGRATFLHGRKPGKKASFPMKTPFES